MQQQAPGADPGLMTTVQAFRRDAFMAQPGRDALAQLQPALAGNDRAPTGKLVRPSADLPIIAPHGARNEPRVGRVIIIVAHVDEGRAVGQADEAGKLLG